MRSFTFMVAQPKKAWWHMAQKPCSKSHLGACSALRESCSAPAKRVSALGKVGPVGPREATFEFELTSAPAFRIVGFMSRNRYQMGADEYREIEKISAVAGVEPAAAARAARVRSPWPDLSLAQAQRVLDYLYSLCRWSGTEWERDTGKEFPPLRVPSADPKED